MADIGTPASKIHAGQLMMGVATAAAPPAVAEGTVQPLSTDLTGALRTSGGGGGAGSADHATTGTADGRITVTTAGTRVPLAASTPAKWVIASAELDNTGVVVIGGATVVAALATRRGVPLAAGESIMLPIDNLADVFIDATVSTEGVTFVYGT
jgi:hypothetical protein